MPKRTDTYIVAAILPHPDNPTLSNVRALVVKDATSGSDAARKARELMVVAEADEAEFRAVPVAKLTKVRL